MILIIYAHPYPQHSHANKRMLEQAGTLEGVEIRSLYQLYPDFNIDVAAEQAALARADLVIWQHPMQWYSVPPLLKLWMDKVLSHGWAYGHNGIALRGKSLMWAVTTGGGDVRLDSCRGVTEVATGAGDISAHVAGGRWQARSGAGDIIVTVPPGVPVWQDLSSPLGDVTSRLGGRGAPAEGQDHIEITARTGTGDISLS